MIRAEKVSKEAINRANQLLHNIFAEDIDGLYGKWSFVHKPPFGSFETTGLNSSP